MYAKILLAMYFTVLLAMLTGWFIQEIIYESRQYKKSWFFAAFWNV